MFGRRQTQIVHHVDEIRVHKPAYTKYTRTKVCKECRALVRDAHNLSCCPECGSVETGELYIICPKCKENIDTFSPFWEFEVGRWLGVPTEARGVWVPKGKEPDDPVVFYMAQKVREEPDGSVVWL